MTVCFCGANIPVFGSVLWCNECIDEYLALAEPRETMEHFIARKRQEAVNAIPRDV